MGCLSSLKAGKMVDICSSDIWSKSFGITPWTMEKWIKQSIVWLAPSTMDYRQRMSDGKQEYLRHRWHRRQEEGERQTQRALLRLIHFQNKNYISG